MNDQMIIVVLGMHRSGSSALAKLFVDLGFDPGSNLMPPNKDNPAGYWEDLDIYALNNEILGFLFLSWDQTEDLSLRRVHYFKTILHEHFAGRAEELLNIRIQRSGRIVIKDPRISILMPFWSDIFEKTGIPVKYFLIVRNPLDVAASLKNRNGMGSREATRLWSHYYNACLHDLEADVYIQHYEDLMLEPQIQTEKISKFLGFDKKSTFAKINTYALDFISKKLQHHKSDIDCVTHPKKNPLPEDITILYKALRDQNQLVKNRELQNLIHPEAEPEAQESNKDQLISSLAVKCTKADRPDQWIQVKHGSGSVKLSFNINSGQSCFDFELYLCDKPCIAVINSVRLRLGQDSILIDELKGNELIRFGSLYVFTSNIPRIKFTLNRARKLRYVEIDLRVEIDRGLLSGFVLPALANISKKIEKTESDDKNSIKELEAELKKMDSILDAEKQKYLILCEMIDRERAESRKELLRVIHEKSSAEQRLKSFEETVKKNDEQEALLDLRLKNQQQELLELSKTNTSIGNEKIYFEKQLREQSLLLNTVKNKLRMRAEEMNDLRLELNEEKAKSEYLWSLKQKNEDEIMCLKEEIRKTKASLSWRLSVPVRIFLRYLFFVFYPVVYLSKDAGYGIALLKREGLKSFGSRLLWYCQGKRLPTDIYLVKTKTELKQLANGKIDTSIPIEFPEVTDPVVSIVIPVHNNWDYTYRCLKSIRENTGDVAYEVIIADDQSDDETINTQNVIKNIRYLRNDDVLHFVRNCKKAASEAKGRYINFLNNDVVVHPGWLSSLIMVLESDEKAGIVGSKLIYPDGRLQEAGGIIWNDATGWNYGKLDDPDKSEYNYLKETDYISGASLMVRKELWEQVEGFDEHFAPAYYEDTDLAFRVRASGYKVIYQPLSVITHFEGISHGTNEQAGVKKYQAVNRDKFYKRYSNILENEQEKPGTRVFTARERSKDKKQVLVIDHYVPHYDKDAGSRSTFSYLKLLVEMGFNVKFIGDNFYRHEPYTTTLQQMGIEVLYGNYYQSHVHDWIKENGEYFDYVFAHRMHIAPKYFQSLKLHTSARIIYIGHDLQFLSSQRKFEITHDKNHQKDAEKFRQIETYIFNTVDMILPFSTFEAPHIKKIVPHKIVEPVPVYFYDCFPEVHYDFTSRKDILFVGGFGHPPNVDALDWMVTEIFPLVKESLPDARLIVVGSNPTEEIRAMASDDIVITGYVTDEQLEAYYTSCKLAVLPLRFGAGVKGKLLEALYYSIPAVISPVSAEGIPEIEEYVAIADRPDEFAEYIRLLYMDEEAWLKYARAGRKLIEKYYSKKVVQKTLERLLL